MTDLVDIEWMGTMLRASDIAGNAVSFDVTGWESSVEPASFAEPIDALAAGRVSSLRYDLTNWIRINRLDGDLDVQTSCGSHTDIELTADDAATYELPDGEYQCRIEENFFITIHIDGQVEITKRQFGPVTFSFPHPTKVTFGFRTMVDAPSQEVTVEPTVEGIATGLSHLPAALKTTGADRVHRNYREYPPRLTIGEETDVPEAVREATPETGVELVVPDSLDALFAGASLAYFTGASVRPGDVTTPKLRADSVGLNHEFTPLPDFCAEASDLLRRTFYLELMMSWLGPDEMTVEEYTRLVEAGVTLKDCADAPLAERLATYIELPDDPVEEILPPWPYRMTVEPTPALATVLPHLLHDLAAVSLPTGDASQGDGPATDQLTALKANRHVEGIVGGESHRPDFTATQTAYENRLRYLDGGGDPIRIRVIVEDAADETLGEALCDRYRRRDDNRSLLVDLLVEPTTEELRTALKQGGAFVHYVGDCTGGGLGCWNGSLEVASVSENNVELFVLDGPGANAVADGLVSTGSVACATRTSTATVPAVDGNTDAETAPPGLSAIEERAMIGELLLYGQCLSSAATCSSTLGGSAVDAVVGDATHRFMPSWRPSPIYVLEEHDDGIKAMLVSFPVDPVGAQWVPEMGLDARFTSVIRETDIQPDEIGILFDDDQIPLFFDGKLYWSDEQKQLLYPIA